MIRYCRSDSWKRCLALRILFLLLGTREIHCFRPYSTYQFAPNGVCLSPVHFVVVNNDDDKSTRSTAFTMRSVPGDGDCMFLAVALATLTSMGLGGNDSLLRAISRETRDVVATVLEAVTAGHLVIEGQRLVTPQALLRAAAKTEGLSTEEYLIQLRKEGSEGGLYGGGPELIVLANVLRRPISIYEINPERIQENDVAYIQRMGVFGNKFFQDPLEDLPESAILTHPLVQKGAYSWHLHILVVETSQGEKHACVLLPQVL